MEGRKIQPGLPRRVGGPTSGASLRAPPHRAADLRGMIVTVMREG